MKAIEKHKKNNRYLSWEHCYTEFCNAREGRIQGKELNNDDYDYLSLHLAFYLASWGMYRGSSFLLQKDYKVHIPIVKLLLKKEYDCLEGIDCEEFDEEKIEKFGVLYEKLEVEYKKIGGKTKTDQVSDTLITKVLLGTLACVPAYDRFFKDGVKHVEKSTIQPTFNKNKSIEQLVKFYKDNSTVLEDQRKTMKVNKKKYPQMKILDMIIWVLGGGMDLNKEEKTKKNTKKNQTKRT